MVFAMKELGKLFTNSKDITKNLAISKVFGVLIYRI